MMSLDEMKAMFDAINAGGEAFDCDVARPYTDVEYYADQIRTIFDVQETVATMLAGELLRMSMSKYDRAVELMARWYYENGIIAACDEMEISLMDYMTDDFDVNDFMKNVANEIQEIVS